MNDSAELINTASGENLDISSDNSSSTSSSDSSDERYEIIEDTDAVAHPKTADASCQADLRPEENDEYLADCEADEPLDSDAHLANTPNVLVINLKQNTVKVKRKKRKKEPTSLHHRFDLVQLLATDSQLLAVAGVTLAAYELFLEILFSNSDSPRPQELLIFLLRTKLNLSFEALRYLFHLDIPSISETYYRVLRHMSIACKNFVFWPEQEVVRETTPKRFLPKYERVRALLEAVEFRVGESKVINRGEKLYSRARQDYTLKAILGCTPGGMISFVSRCYGGRTSNLSALTASGVLEKFETGDTVITGGDFPIIKVREDDKEEKLVSLLLPCGECMGKELEELAKEVDSAASLRIVAESVIGRVRSYRALERFSDETIPHADRLVLMACVMVNLLPVMIKEED